MSTINSDETVAEHGVRSGPEQPLAPECHDKPGASSYQQYTAKKSKGESVSGAEWRRVPASRRAAEMTSLDRHRHILARRINFSYIFHRFQKTLQGSFRDLPG